MLRHCPPGLHSGHGNSLPEGAVSQPAPLQHSHFSRSSSSAIIATIFLHSSCVSGSSRAAWATAPSHFPPLARMRIRPRRIRIAWSAPLPTAGAPQPTQRPSSSILTPKPHCGHHVPRFIASPSLLVDHPSTTWRSPCGGRIPHPAPVCRHNESVMRWHYASSGGGTPTSRLLALHRTRPQTPMPFPLPSTAHRTVNIVLRYRRPAFCRTLRTRLQAFIR
jgi:hypothetical protein